MSDVVVLCVSRGRPDAALDMARSFRATAELIATELVIVIDHDDPELSAYLAIPEHLTNETTGPIWPPDRVRVMMVDGGNLSRATNEAAERIWNDDCIIGHVGDFHRFATVGWDRLVIAALAEPGVAFGDDGFWHGELPTAVFISSQIPQALGWFALPTSTHYEIDDAWKALGRGLGRLRYLPRVHLPFVPGAVRQEHDETFIRAQATRKHDLAAFRYWRANVLAADVARVKAAL